MHTHSIFLVASVVLSTIATPLPSSNISPISTVDRRSSSSVTDFFQGLLKRDALPSPTSYDVIIDTKRDDTFEEGLRARSGGESRDASASAGVVEARARVDTTLGRGGRRAAVEGTVSLDARQRMSGGGRGRSIEIDVEEGAGLLEARQRMSGGGRGRSVASNTKTVANSLQARQRMRGSGRGGRSIARDADTNSLEARQRMRGSGRGGRSVARDADADLLEARQRMRGSGRG